MQGVFQEKWLGKGMLKFKASSEYYHCEYKEPKLIDEWYLIMHMKTVILLKSVKKKPQK